MVNIVDGALSDGDSSSVVTFTFSEAPGEASPKPTSRLGRPDAQCRLAVDDRRHPLPATVTAVDSFTGTGTVSLAAGSWTDAALNLGGAGSDRVAIDRRTRR